MGRKAADPRENLKLWLAELGEASPDDVVNANTMARIAGMTWQHFRDRYVRPDPSFPVEKKGKEGSGYEFRTVNALNHLIWNAINRIDVSDAEQRKLTEKSGVEVPAEDRFLTDSAMTARIGALNALQKMKRDQGLLIPAAVAKKMIEAVVNGAQIAVYGGPSRFDPTGRLPAEYRAFHEAECSALAVSIMEEGERQIDKVDAFARDGHSRTGNRL